MLTASIRWWVDRLFRTTARSRMKSGEKDGEQTVSKWVVEV